MAVSAAARAATVGHDLGAQPIVPNGQGGYFDSDLPACLFGGLYGAAVSG